MRVYFLSFMVFVSLCSITYAQQTDSSRVETSFFKENGWEVKSEDEADYVRVTQPIDSGIIRYKFVEYYRDGKKKREGTALEFPALSKFDLKYNRSKNTKLRIHGRIVEYYRNGKGKSITAYNDEVKVGVAYLFYENGNLKEIRDYHNDRKSDGRYKTVQLVDSLSNKYLLDSTSSGTIVSNDEDFSMELPYKNGYRHGLQKQYWYKEKIDIQVLYNNGQIVSAKRMGGDVSVELKAGNVSIRSKIVGFPTFMSLIFDRIQRSARILKLNGEEARRIEIGFILEENGSITNLELMKPIPDNEAIIKELFIIIKSIDKWFPVLGNGQSERIHLTTPFILPLQTPSNRYDN